MFKAATHSETTNKESSPAVTAEAQKLEGLAHQFLSGTDEDSAVKAFHQELQGMQKQGLGFTESVFAQVKNDNSGTLNPLLPQVDIVDYTGGGQLIQFGASTSEWLFGMNHRDLMGIVDDSSVVTSALEGRNGFTGQKSFWKHTWADNQESKPQFNYNINHDDYID